MKSLHTHSRMQAWGLFVNEPRVLLEINAFSIKPLPRVILRLTGKVVKMSLFCLSRLRSPWQELQSHSTTLPSPTETSPWPDVRSFHRSLPWQSALGIKQSTEPHGVWSGDWWPVGQESCQTTATSVWYHCQTVDGTGRCQGREEVKHHVSFSPSTRSIDFALCNEFEFLHSRRVLCFCS